MSSMQEPEIEQQFLFTNQIYREKGLFIGDDQPLLQVTCVFISQLVRLSFHPEENEGIVF